MKRNFDSDIFGDKLFNKKNVSNKTLFKARKVNSFVRKEVISSRYTVRNLIYGISAVSLILISAVSIDLAHDSFQRWSVNMQIKKEAAAAKQSEVMAFDSNAEYVPVISHDSVGVTQNVGRFVDENIDSIVASTELDMSDSDTYVVYLSSEPTISVNTIDILLDRFGEAGDSEELDAKRAEFEGKFVTDIDSLNIRESADRTSSIVGILYKGAIGEVIGQVDGWTKITSGGVTGYVKSDYILTGDENYEAYVSAKKTFAVISVDELNIRDNATTNSNVIGVAKKGDMYPIDTAVDSSEWVRIRTLDFTYAYVSANCVTKTEGYEEAYPIKEIDDYIAAKEEFKKNNDLAEEDKDEKETAAEKNTEAATEKKTEATTEKKAEATTEKQTEATTEKKTEATTEAATEKQTEEVTEKETEASTEKQTEAETEEKKGNEITVSTTQRSSFSLSDEDMKLLAAIVYAESGGESYEGQLAVANVVLTRLRSGRWGSTVSDVVYASSQFTAINSQAFKDALENGASATSQRAAAAAASGTNNMGSFVSFRPTWNANPESYDSYTIIGNHCFF